jgi:hypothetical protein
MASARTIARRLFCLLPPMRNWFEELDQLASDSRRWRAAQARNGPDSIPVQPDILNLMAYFKPKRVSGFNKIRLGQDGDGGYVLLDDFATVSGALSLGISDDCSWDLEIAARGINVHQYDHSVDGPPTGHPRFWFFKKMISAQMSDQSDTLGSALAKLPPPEAGHIVLKIDIEGYEWEVLDAASPDELARFSQIVGEFHSFSNLLDPTWRARAQRVMRKLHSVFDVVHVHANNYGPLLVIANVPVPEALEVTLANRAMYHCEETDELFPTAIDQPNLEERPDIFLGNLRFR